MQLENKKMLEVRQLNSSDADFQQQLETLLSWEAASDTAVTDTVKDILSQVKNKGDEIGRAHV